MHSFLFNSISFALVAMLLLVTSSTEAANIKRPSTGVKKGTAPKQMDTTCTRFRDACIKAVMDGKMSGTFPVIFDCYKKSTKKTSFYFSCLNGGESYTDRALQNLYGGTTSTLFTASGISTKIISTETDFTSTTSSIYTTQTNTQTISTTDVSSYFTTSTTGVTTTQPVTTVESFVTTQITSTFVPTTVLVTSTVTTTSTSTASSTVTALVPVVIYQITSSAPAKRAAAESISSVTFCSAYSSSCTRQCAKSSSTPPRFELCKQKAIGIFSLSCMCKGGNVQTQHALADIGADVHVQVVSTLSTFSTIATATNTVIIPTTIVSKATLTTTSHIVTPTTLIATVTSTGTAFSTSTSSTTSTTFQPTTITVPTTSTASTQTVTSVTTTATTVVIIAPTGKVQATYPNGKPNRYVSRLDTTNRGLNTLVTDKSQAADVMLVYDPVSQLYALSYTSGGLYLSIEGSSSLSGSSYGFLVSAAGRAYGPAGGKGPWASRPYESTVYSLDPTQNANSQIALKAFYVQPDNTRLPINFYDDPEGVNDYILMGGPGNSYNFFTQLQMAIVPS